MPDNDETKVLYPTTILSRVTRSLSLSLPPLSRASSLRFSNDSIELSASPHNPSSDKISSFMVSTSNQLGGRSLCTISVIFRSEIIIISGRDEGQEFLHCSTVEIDYRPPDSVSITAKLSAKSKLYFFSSANEARRFASIVMALNCRGPLARRLFDLIDSTGAGFFNVDRIRTALASSDSGINDE